MTSSLQFRHDPSSRRYEAWLDGELAGHIEYSVDQDDDGQVIVSILHTVIGPDFEGRGIASALTSHVTKQIRADGHKLRPVCTYTQDWIDRHQDRVCDILH